MFLVVMHMCMYLKRKSPSFTQSQGIVFFFGYTIKGYGLWDPTDHKVIVSRDVIFNEKSMQRKEVQ